MFLIVSVLSVFSIFQCLINYSCIYVFGARLNIVSTKSLNDPCYVERLNDSCYVVVFFLVLD